MNCAPSIRKSNRSVFVFVLVPPPSGTDTLLKSTEATSCPIALKQRASAGELDEIKVPTPAPIAPAITLSIKLIESAATSSWRLTSCANAVARAVYKTLVSETNSAITK